MTLCSWRGVSEGVENDQKFLHRGTVVGRGAPVLIPDDSVGVNHEVAAHLAQVATPEVVQAPASQQFEVCQHGPWAEQFEQTPLGQPICSIDVPLGVRKQWECGSDLAGQLEQPVPRFEGNRDHLGVSCLNFCVVLAQLRQVLPSGQSSKVAQKYQNNCAAPEILKGHEPAVGVWKGKIGRSPALQGVTQAAGVMDQSSRFPA